MEHGSLESDSRSSGQDTNRSRQTLEAKESKYVIGQTQKVCKIGVRKQ